MTLPRGTCPACDGLGEVEDYAIFSEPRRPDSNTDHVVPCPLCLGVGVPFPADLADFFSDSTGGAW